MLWFFFVYIDVYLFLLYLYWDHKHRKGLLAEDLEAREFFVKFLMGVLIAIRILKGVFFEDFYDRKFADIYDKRNTERHEFAHDVCLVSAAPFAGLGCYYLVGEDDRDDRDVCYEKIAGPVCVYEIKRKAGKLKSNQEIESFIEWHLSEIRSRYPDYLQGRRIMRLIEGVQGLPDTEQLLFDRFIRICVNQYDFGRCGMAMEIFRSLDKDEKILRNKLKRLLRAELTIRALKYSREHNKKSMGGFLATPEKIDSALDNRNSEIERLRKNGEDMKVVEEEIRKALEYFAKGFSSEFDLNYLEPTDLEQAP